VYPWLGRGYIILRQATIIELQLEVVVNIGRDRYWEDGVLRKRKVRSNLDKTEPRKIAMFQEA